jgi:hypothetical protein
VLLEGLGQLKKSTSSGFDPATFQLVTVVPQPTTLPRVPLHVYSASLISEHEVCERATDESTSFTMARVCIDYNISNFLEISEIYVDKL